MIARSTAALLVLALAVSARAEDDPEPPGGALRRLQGVWQNRAVLVQGKEMEGGATFTFAKDKLTYSPGPKGRTQEMALIPDRKRKNLFELKMEKGQSLRYFFEFEKGELFLAPVRPDDADPKPDFSSNNTPVLILKREKK